MAESEPAAAFGVEAAAVVEPALGPAVANEAVEHLERHDWSVAVAEAAADVVVVALGLGIGFGLGAGVALQPESKHEIVVDPALELHVAGTVEIAVAEERNTVAAGKDHIQHIADNIADTAVDTTAPVLA